MPEYLRALAYILLLSAPVFWYFRRPLTTSLIAPEAFVLRRNTWYGITLAGFLSQSFWVFIIMLAVLLLNARKKEHNPFGLFFFVLLALPQIKQEIPGVFGINYFYTIDYVRMLTLFLLLPVAAAEWNRKAKDEPGFATDKVLFLYLAMVLVLRANVDTVGNSIRFFLDTMIDVAIPYYALTRGIKSLEQLNDILASFAMGALVAAMLGVFEFARHWILYSSMNDALNIPWKAGYQMRGDSLRASVTSWHSIVFGYIMAIAIGCYLYLSRQFAGTRDRLAGFLLLTGGIVVSLSRGPWVGGVAMLVVFFALQGADMRQYAKGIAAGLVVVAGLLLSDYRDKLLSYLPFIGTVDAQNVDYRLRLFEVSLTRIAENPWLGASDYLLKMEEMRQGEGIIDLVNTFLVVALNTGLIGLFLFVLFFVIVLFQIIRASRLRKLDNKPFFTLGNSLFAVVCGMLVIIATVSPISHVPLMYWTFGSIGLAYAKLFLNKSA